MKPTEDFVLEYALARVFERNEDALTARILAGLRESGPVGGAVPSVRLHRGSESSNPVRRRALVPMIGVALVLIVAGMTWMSMLQPSPSAVSDAPVLTNRGGTWMPTERTEFLPGDQLVVSGHVEFRTSAGGVITARAGTVFEVGEAGTWTLSLGSVRLVSGVSPVRIHTPTCTIRVGPSSSVELVGVTEDYADDPDLSLIELARRIRMLDTMFVISVTATLLQGTGELIVDGEVRPLSPGVPVRQDAKKDTAGIAELRKQIGTWKVTVVGGAREITGVEVCRAGSGDHSIVSQIEIQRGNRRIETTVLLSYDPRRRRYSGLYSDSFGGELGLLLGRRTGAGKERVLQMNKFHGGEFGIRQRMRWVTDDERRTVMEMMRDGKWQQRRVMIHRRQPEPQIRLREFVLNVRGMQKQVEFYRDALGLTVTDANGQNDFSARQTVRMATNGMSIVLRAGRKSINSGEEPGMTFRVDDLTRSSERARRAGAKVSAVRSPSPGLSVVDCRDLEGNGFRLEAHKAGKSP